MTDPDVLSLGNFEFIRLISSAEIAEKVEAVAKSIESDMRDDESPLFLCVLNGAFMFASDLLKNYNALCELAFVRISSYDGTQSTGTIKSFSGLDKNQVAGRTVIVVEDIVETGLTMNYLLNELKQCGAKDVRIAALFVKPQKLLHNVSVDYSCFEIGDEFIVGYGLDCDGLYRNLPAIYVKEN